MLFLEILFRRFGHIIVKYFTKKKLFLLYICPIFSILKKILNMSFDEKYESLQSFFCLWQLKNFTETVTRRTFSLSCPIIFFLVVVFVFQKNFLLFVPASGHVTVINVAEILKFWNFEILKKYLRPKFSLV